MFRVAAAFFNIVASRLRSTEIRQTELRGSDQEILIRLRFRTRSGAATRPEPVEESLLCNSDRKKKLSRIAEEDVDEAVQAVGGRSPCEADEEQLSAHS